MILPIWKVLEKEQFRFLNEAGNPTGKAFKLKASNAGCIGKLHIAVENVEWAWCIHKDTRVFVLN